MLREFGRLDDGRSVHAVALGGASGLQAEILSYGGVLRQLSVPGPTGRVSVVLGHADLVAYQPNEDYLGTLVGRFGNRIARSRFALDGREHLLSANEGRNHLHGGHLGFGRHLWRISESAADRLVLEHRSPARDEGYPGTLDVAASFRLDGDCLELAYTATTDAPTPVNLTHHPYFNLAGDAAVPAARQWLRVPADRYLPVDRELIPTGEIASVAATPFDFRQPAMIERNARPPHEQIARGRGYDHCLVLADDADCVAELYSPHSGVAMRIVSDAPAVQFYEGQGLDARHPHLGRGVCLEPQGFPDAPNRLEFPGAILQPGETYRRRIRYCFAAVPPHSDWNDAIAALNRCAPEGLAP